MVLYLKKLSNDFDGKDVKKVIGKYECTLTCEVQSNGNILVIIKKESVEPNRFGMIFNREDKDVIYLYGVVVDKRWLFTDGPTYKLFDTSSLCIEVTGRGFEDINDFNKKLVDELLIENK